MAARRFLPSSVRHACSPAPHNPFADPSVPLSPISLPLFPGAECVRMLLPSLLCCADPDGRADDRLLPDRRCDRRRLYDLRLGSTGGGKAIAVWRFTQVSRPSCFCYQMRLAGARATSGRDLCVASPCRPRIPSCH